MSISRRDFLKVALASAALPLSAHAAKGVERTEYRGADDPQAYRDFLEQQSDDAVVVSVFHAEWCGPCKQLFKQLDEIAQQPGVRFKVVGVDVGPPRLSESPFKNILRANNVFATPTTEILAAGRSQYKMMAVIQNMPSMTHYLRDLTRAVHGDVPAPRP